MKIVAEKKQIIELFYKKFLYRENSRVLRAAALSRAGEAGEFERRERASD